VRSDNPHILLVNPWIHDFAAYDFWAKPMGLLYLGSLLRHHGFVVSYIDCLDRFHPKAPPTDPRSRFGRGPYLKSPIPKPAGLHDVPRTYSRYGIEPSWFRTDLRSLGRPDLILVTSFMTYWYPGVQETIGTIREVFPSVPVVLGGIYASLCPDHARKHCGADSVVAGPGEDRLGEVMSDHLAERTQSQFQPDDLDGRPYPAYDLQTEVTYVPLLTSSGCPFGCAYCASGFLNPKRRYRHRDSILDEIRYWHTDYGVEDFVLYDDAFLSDAETHAIPFLEGVLASGLSIRFHTPNAIHIREVTSETATLMYHAGLTSLRLGLETGDFANRADMDRKVTESEFGEAVGYLREAGFGSDQIGAYLLVGLPGESIQSVEASIDLAIRSGVTPILAHYSPIPHTKMWDQAAASSRYDLASDPIYTNNAIFPCRQDEFSWQILSRLKDRASGLVRDTHRRKKGCIP